MKELWVPLSGMKAQQRQLEAIANNVANANTNAFKKDRVIFKEHLTAYENGADINLPNKEFSPDDFYHSYGAENSHVVIDGSYTDYSQGQIQPTNNPLDLALEGKGFIEVLGPHGIRYTRNGSFYLDKDGVLVNGEGMKILSKIDLPEVGEGEEALAAIRQIPSPENRIIKLGKEKITINHQGEIFQAGNKISRINIVEFKDVTHLKKEGNSLFVNNDTQNILKTEVKTNVRQGALEMSNVNPIHEMNRLINMHRHLDSIQRVIKTYDNMAGRNYNEIAKF